MTLPSSPYNTHCPCLPLPATSSLVTDAVASSHPHRPSQSLFLPNRAASRYDSIAASATVTISLFPFNCSEHRCLYVAAILYRSNLSLPSVIRVAPSSVATIPFPCR
ncbi:hypothetical protein B296_00053043 [Ensete ventricosum]|uniref:Uncharacterized protein n=1 Tax=Ensete ventricosum TaxID=4639 RepID=A0A426XLI1_ENSVE|nr:hypothetical protein B296_00053043 [Ensete ventricosum]